MTGLSASPKLVKAGLIVLDAGSGAVKRTVSLQYNPETLSRSYQVQGAGGDEGAERAQPFRLKGPAIETLSLEAQIDATDSLERPDQNANAVRHGVGPQLAVLEGLVNPAVADLVKVNEESKAGTLEILPPEAPLVLFVWGASRVVPVRVTELSVTEDAFDASLNPVRATVKLGLRVLTTDDLGFENRGGSIFVNHLRTRESLAGKTGTASLESVGLASAP